MRYRSKVVEIDAVEWTGFNREEVALFMGINIKSLSLSGLVGLNIRDKMALPGDLIIRGTEGEYRPCMPSIFHAKYEPIKE